MSNVYANGRSIVHAGDGHTQASGPPDVCNTPSPSGPTPLAYPNFALDRDLANGTQTVKIAGNPVALADSNIRTSTGDEAGSLGGLMSHKTKGKLTFGSSSLDVIIEGTGVVRFGDVTQHNGNTYNTVLAAAGKVASAYGDDPLDGDDCPICGESKPKHRIGPSDDIVEKAQKLKKALQSGPFAQYMSKGRPRKTGVMIGVLSCQCPVLKQYAGMSGAEFATDSFREGARMFFEEAKKLGLKPVVHPPPPPPLSGFKPMAGGGFGATSEAQWADALDRIDNVHRKENLRANAPMVCVAPKLIQECLADGHKPGTLIEIWLALRAGRRIVVPRVHCLVLDPDTGETRIECQSREFEDGQDVPSCTTCQIICTEMLCNTGKPPCP